MNKLNILVLDDDGAVAQLVSDFIDMAGHQSTMATCYSQFKEKMREQSFDAIIMDMCMPDHDAVEYLRNLSSIAYKGAVVVITGFDTRLRQTVEHYGEALGLTIVSGLSKPIDRTALTDFMAGQLAMLTLDDRSAGAAD